VTGRGHQAPRPPADYRVEPVLTGQGVVVTVVNREGLAKSFDFTGLPAPEPMQRSLAAAFAEQSRRWTSHQSASHYWAKLVVFTRFLSEFERPPQDLHEVTLAMFKRWRAKNVGSNAGRAALRDIRTLLRRDPRLQVGAVAEELARRIPRPEPASARSSPSAGKTSTWIAAQRP
jgi:hypothetical protein